MHFKPVRMCVSLAWGFVLILYVLLGFIQICSLYDLKYTWNFMFLILTAIAMSYLDLGMPWGFFHRHYNKIYPYYWFHVSQADAINNMDIFCCNWDEKNPKAFPGLDKTCKYGVEYQKDEISCIFQIIQRTYLHKSQQHVQN